jgi:hypothetical protein
LAALEQTGVCPTKSQAGPVGHALGVVSFGKERVPEEVTVQPYFAPGGLEFYVRGSSPTIIELISKGHFASGAPAFGEKFIGEVPLVSTVPGAPYASTERISVTVGAAIKRGGKTVYYGEVPKKCPKGGFPVKAELTFEAYESVPKQTVTTSYKVPCPRR